MATSDRLAAEPVNLHQLFSADNIFRCPLFQRPFVWKKANISRLWDDIDSVREGVCEVRFLGALVFDNEAGSTSNSPGLYWIIDGQQRITSLYLSLCALAETAEEAGATDIAHSIANEYLLSRKLTQRLRPKFAPTVSDTRQFNRVISQSIGTIAKVNFSTESGEDTGRLTEAYWQIREAVRVRCQDSQQEIDLDSLAALRDTLLERLEFVEIRLGQRHDANEVFDRLNKEGERLGIVDLVRNEVLKRLKDDVEIARDVHAKEWRPFEKSFPDVKSMEGYFFPHALSRDSAITKSRTFIALAKHWSEAHAHLDGAAEVAGIMRDLEQNVPIYTHLKHEVPLRIQPGKYSDALSTMARMQAPTVILPYFFSLHAAYVGGEVTENVAARCVRIIESFLVRRALCGYEPTGLHAVFKSLWGKAGADANAVRASLETRTITFPSDGEFKSAVRSAPLYTKHIRNFVILEFERSYTRGDVLKTFPDMTVDHVMPQKANGPWLQAFTKTQFERWVDTWANLVPLSGKANSEKGRRSWAETRKALRCETVFATTKHLLEDYDDWTPDQLKDRADKLAAWACRRWPSQPDHFDP